MNYSDRLALIREYKNQGGKGSYLSLLKSYAQGGNLPTYEGKGDSQLPVIDNAAYFRTQQPAQQVVNPQVFNVNTSPQVVRVDNTAYQPKFDKNYEWPEFGGNLEGVTIKPSNIPYRNDVQSRREDIQKVPITAANMKQFPQATQREFMKQQVADRPDYEGVKEFANLAATGFGLAPVGIIDEAVKGAVELGSKYASKYVPKIINKIEDISEPISNKIVSNTNPTSSFKSDIDWAKWNKEIPENKTLLQEYNAIEQRAKSNSTWMKNSDGSKFEGAPEQFVQQQSSNFKKAFPNYYNRILNHNSPSKFDEFSDKFFGKTSDDGWYGKGIYTHPSKSYTKDYGDINYELYTNSENKGFINETNIQGSKYYNKSYKGELKNIDNQISSYIKEIKDNPSDYPDSEFFIEKINNMGKLKKSTFKANFKNKLKNNLDNYTTLENPHNGEVVIPFNNPVKSAIGNNGMFDMNNPNIYKTVLPLGVGVVGANQFNKNSK